MKYSAVFILSLILSSCANIIAPNGGEKDISPPKIKNITLTKDETSINIYFLFDEYFQLNDWANNFYSSPKINIIEKKIKQKQLIINIKNEDVNPYLTYNLSLKNTIKDLNENNILDSLNYMFSLSNINDTFSINGQLKDAYTLENISNAWIMLFKSNTHDSLIFKSTPMYMEKPNNNGKFYFPNLKKNNYKIYALTNNDFLYEENEKIAFTNDSIDFKTPITMYAYNPLKEDSIYLLNKGDSINNGKNYGSITIIAKLNNACIFQLLQNNNIIYESYFDSSPYKISNISSGEYKLKYIQDINNDAKWNNGDWKEKIMPEKIINYNNNVLIRNNWDLEIIWDINE